MLHNEMILTQSAGVKPMQIIVAATRHPAEWLGKLKDLGTVEQGKLADLIIVKEDPLTDIRNLKGNVEIVILNGKETDTTFHADYQNPIPSIHQTLKYSSETPELDPKIMPRILTEGSDDATITITGRYLTARTQAYFKEVPVPTRVSGRTRMEITIPGELLKEVGAWPITAVDNLEYGPAGSGGFSKPVFLWVKYR
jgi:adenine deaminase